MMAQTMYETLASLLGLPMRAIPLSFCRVTRPYLLERAGISVSGTAILLAIPYVMTADVYDERRKLSLYAVPRDYHGYVKGLGEELIPRLKEAFPHSTFALFADHAPIAEVDAAARAGLGVLGENGLLLTPEYGSLVFIAEVCTDADYETVTGQSSPAFPTEPPTCEACGACMRACPTKGGLCLSALTQKKGILTEEETALLKAHPLVWGCDACQLACPHNRRVINERRDTPVPYFRELRRIGMTAAELDAMRDEELNARAYAWRGRAVIRRNVMMKEEEL